jgi:lipoprotein-anchoring transpeptidase ErfK/SrfK
VAPTTAASTTTVPPTTAPPPQPAQPDPAPPLKAPVTPGAIAAAQQRLLDLGFWLDGVNGKNTWATSQALLAFQKYNGLPRTSRLDAATANALTTATIKAFGAANLGDLVEIDKTRQVLFVINAGKVVWAFNTSTGSGKPYSEQNQKDPTQQVTGVAITPSGWFKVNRQQPSGWWEGDLGKIYRPKYFNGGIAVHGMTNVPAYPASHGCVRVSLPAMDFIWAQNLIPMGMRVWVH